MGVLLMLVACGGSSSGVRDAATCVAVQKFVDDHDVHVGAGVPVSDVNAIEAASVGGSSNVSADAQVFELAERAGESGAALGPGGPLSISGIACGKAGHKITRLGP